MQPKTLNVVTLFHNPSLAASTHVLGLLKHAAITAESTAFDSPSAKRTFPGTNEVVPRAVFELEVTEKPPTIDQLSSILDYLNGTNRVMGKPSDLVAGARTRDDALRRVKQNADLFMRPVVCWLTGLLFSSLLIGQVVDWGNGKAVYGENVPEIVRLLRELPED